MGKWDWQKRKNWRERWGEVERDLRMSEDSEGVRVKVRVRVWR